MPELQGARDVTNVRNTSGSNDTDRIRLPDLMIKNPTFEDRDSSKSKKTNGPTVRDKDVSSVSEGEKPTGTHDQFTVFPT